MNIRWTLTGLLLLGQYAWADNQFDDIRHLDQDTFKSLTANMGSAIGYKAINPTEPLEGLGFDMNIQLSNDSLENAPLNHADTYGQGRYLPPELRMFTDLPFGIEIGGFYSSVPLSDISLMGGEVNYAIVEDQPLGGPAVSIRGTFTRLTGIQDFGLETRGLELAVSKGFATFTPYAGLGTVWINGETGVDGLNNESLTQNKYFMGFNFNLGMMNFAAEAEQTGDSASTSAKFGVRF